MKWIKDERVTLVLVVVAVVLVLGLIVFLLSGGHSTGAGLVAAGSAVAAAETARRSREQKIKDFHKREETAKKAKERLEKDKRKREAEWKKIEDDVKSKSLTELAKEEEERKS